MSCFTEGRRTAMRRVTPVVVCTLLLFLLPGLVGCGIFRDRKDDYMRAKQDKPLEIPPQLSSAAIQDLYVVPEIKTRAVLPETFEIPRPAPLIAEKSPDVVRIQSLGADRWILANVSPSQLWPQLRHFLLSNKFAIAKEQGNRGVIETRWSIPSADSKKLERYHIKVEPGVQRNSAEVHVRQIEKPRSDMTDKAFAVVSDNIDRERWFTDELSQYLANNVGTTSVSRLALDIGSESKLRAVRDEKGYMKLIIKLPYNRAWASVHRALEKADFKVDDINREQGVYYIQYWPAPTEDDRPNWFFRLFGAKMPETGDVDYARERYTLEVREKQNSVELVLHQDDDDFKPIEAEKLLNLIKGYLT